MTEPEAGSLNPPVNNAVERLLNEDVARGVLPGAVALGRVSFIDHSRTGTVET